MTTLMSKLKMNNNANKNPHSSAKPTAKRVVGTSRWIHNNELEVGMYVRELDRPWAETNFMFQGFVVDSVSRLNDVRRVSEYVCIDASNVGVGSFDKQLSA